MSQENDIEHLLKEYKLFLLGARGRSENTVRIYLTDLRPFLQFLSQEDLEVAKRVFNTIYESNPDFSFYDLAEFLDKNKDITAINQQRIGINWYNKHLDELKNDPGRHF